MNSFCNNYDVMKPVNPKNESDKGASAHKDSNPPRVLSNKRLEEGETSIIHELYQAHFGPTAHRQQQVVFTKKNQHILVQGA
jgi:hypothetical protein